MQEITLNYMNQRDLDEVCAIERAVFPDPWSYQMFQEELKLPQLYTLVTVRIDGKLIGYGGILTIHNEAHITNLAITPDYQSKGIGSLLLKHLIKLSVTKRTNNISLEVRTDNLVARNLYKKFDFSTIAVRKHYYGYEEDALIMSAENISNPTYLQTLDSKAKPLPFEVKSYF